MKLICEPDRESGPLDRQGGGPRRTFRIWTSFLGKRRCWTEMAMAQSDSRFINFVPSLCLQPPQMLIYSFGVLLIGTFTIILRHRAYSFVTTLEMDNIGISEDGDKF
ncbi:hypothetical protein F5Y06DRAFT_265015 [Hypoxylon sp. FL0890]|nr:hypothetical protein F5Y06DRAFT_265015 [Hypoxylon sp. FL0890]